MFKYFFEKLECLNRTKTKNAVVQIKEKIIGQQLPKLFIRTESTSWLIRLG